MYYQKNQVRIIHKSSYKNVTTTIFTTTFKSDGLQKECFSVLLNNDSHLETTNRHQAFSYDLRIFQDWGHSSADKGVELLATTNKTIHAHNLRAEEMNRPPGLTASQQQAPGPSKRSMVWPAMAKQAKVPAVHQA